MTTYLRHLRYVSSRRSLCVVGPLRALSGRAQRIETLGAWSKVHTRYAHAVFFSSVYLFDFACARNIGSDLDARCRAAYLLAAKFEDGNFVCPAQSPLVLETEAKLFAALEHCLVVPNMYACLRYFSRDFSDRCPATLELALSLAYLVVADPRHARHDFMELCVEIFVRACKNMKKTCLALQHTVGRLSDTSATPFVAEIQIPGATSS
jgi:hypothetical protein